MKGYYCVTASKKEFFYVPSVLFEVNCPLFSRFYFNPSTLENLTLAVKEGRLSRERLEKKGWKVEEVGIPKEFIIDFINFSRRRHEQKKDTAIDIMRFMYESVKDKNRSIEGINNSFDDEYYDGEDYKANWWKRGETWNEQFEY